MSSEANQTGQPDAVAQQAPTEQQESRAGVPKRFAPGQTVCNRKNEKGKLCNGHLKQLHTQHPSAAFLRGDDMLYGCQTCGTLYMGPPMGHMRDTGKQSRYVERDLAAILRAAGGTLPAYDYPAAAWRGDAPKPRPAAPAKAVAPAKSLAAKSAPAATGADASVGGATPAAPASATTKAATTTGASSESATTGADSAASADAHRPAAEAQAATGQASAAPLSPTAATASPAAGAETVSDLATAASTELTPGAPKDDRPQVADAPAAEAKPKPKKASGAGFRVPPELQPKPGETIEEKIARLKRTAEEAKRSAGKL
jgi:hypothetical protein